MKRYRLLLSAGCLLVSSCTCDGPAISTSADKKDTRVSMAVAAFAVSQAEQDKAYKVLFGGWATGLDRSGLQSVVHECIGSNYKPSTGGEHVEVLPLILAGLIGVGIQVAVDLVINYADSQLQKVIATYTAGYGASSSTYFYRASNNTTTVLDLTNNVKCFRVTRTELVPDPNKPGQSTTRTDFDFIGEVAIPVGRQYFQARPLMLYYAKAMAQLPADNSVSTSFSLSGKSTWFNGSQGQTGSPFETVLFADKFTLADGKPVTKYFFVPQSGPGAYLFPAEFEDWSSFDRLPLPPPSIDAKGHVLFDTTTKSGATADPATDVSGYFTGPIVLTGTVNEIAVPPAWLSAVAAAFKAEGSNLSKGVSAAINKAYGFSSGSGS